MMRTTRLRRITLQWRHIRFTEACTLIACSIADTRLGAPLSFCSRTVRFLARSDQPIEARHCHLARNTIRPRVRSYGVSSTVTLSPGRIRM